MTSFFIYLYIYIFFKLIKEISEEIKNTVTKEEETEDSRFNKIFKNKKTTYDKDYKESEKDKIKDTYNKRNEDIDYNEYTFGNEIKRDTSAPQKVIFRKPTSSQKEDNDLITSSSKGVKRKNISNKTDKETEDKDSGTKKPKTKKHKKAKNQKSLLSFSMDDE